MDTAEPRVELLDETGTTSGSMGKREAHQAPGHLHRAFSVFVVDEDDRVLLQRRAPGKYHFAGMWSNTCCSHPGPGDDVAEVAALRTYHEVGVQVALEVVGAFTYRAVDETSGLVEHEHDTVLLGRVSRGTTARPHPDEVAETRWLGVGQLRQELAQSPSSFTPWLGAAMDCLLRDSA